MTVGSLLDILRAMDIIIRLERLGMPTLTDVQQGFAQDADAGQALQATTLLAVAPIIGRCVQRRIHASLVCRVRLAAEISGDDRLQTMARNWRLFAECNWAPCQAVSHVRERFDLKDLSR